VKITKEAKAGILIVVAIALFVYGYNFLKGSDIFSSKKKYFAVYNNVDGLLVSNPIQINGYKVGQVKATKLLNDGTGRILVEFAVDKTLDIPKNVIARIYSFDLLGSKAIKLEFTPSKELTQDGDTLRTDKEDDLKTSVDKRLGPLQKKAEGLISNIDSVMVVINHILNRSAGDNLEKSFESIRRSLETFERTSIRLDTLVKSQQYRISNIFGKIESISTNLAHNNDKITKVLTNFESISDSLAKSNLKSTVNNANKALADAAVIMTKIKKGEGSMGMLINNDSLYRKLDKSAEDLDKLLVDMKENPSRYVHFSVFGKKDKSKNKTKK
jgi:phospholipid/cholesterol/gamma-HCH transport system substrate-binding protein